MHGRRVLSFFSTKKNPMLAWEAEGRMNPAASSLGLQTRQRIVFSRTKWYLGESRSLSHRDVAAEAKWPGL
jgi:hypothetical protein